LAGAEARQPSQQFLQSKLKCNICYLKERFFYPQWMGKRYVPSLPAAAAEFFDELWSKHYQESDRLESLCRFVFASAFLQKSISSEIGSLSSKPQSKS
jgi:hypothetical protein